MTYRRESRDVALELRGVLHQQLAQQRSQGRSRAPAHWKDTDTTICNQILIGY